MSVSSALGRAVKSVSLTLLGLSLLVIFAFGAGAVVTGAAPVSGEGAPVTIHVVSNGFHTDIVVPMVTDAVDWRGLMRLSPITRQSLDAPYLALGWGSRAAYTQLGTLTDLSPGLLLKAIAFDESVVHLQPVASVREGEGVRRLTLTPDGYARLARHVEDSLARTAGGDAVPLDGVTHGTGDAFLRGRDRFWLLRSCNVWVGEALRAAGRPAGLWTPLAQSLMWSLDRAAPAAGTPRNQTVTTTP
jgi:uncharacterized protein (TIGR02117 family)